jgi:hypothetical protein
MQDAAHVKRALQGVAGIIHCGAMLQEVCCAARWAMATVLRPFFYGVFFYGVFYGFFFMVFFLWGSII